MPTQPPIDILKACTKHIEDWSITHANSKLFNAQKETIRNIISNIANNEKIDPDYDYPSFNNTINDFTNLNIYLKTLVIFFKNISLEKFQLLTPVEEIELQMKQEVLSDNKRWHFEMRLIKSKLLKILEGIENKETFTDEEEKEMVAEEERKVIAFNKIVLNSNYVTKLSDEDIVIFTNSYDSTKDFLLALCEQKLAIDKMKLTIDHYEKHIKQNAPEWFIADWEKNIDDYNRRIDDYNRDNKKMQESIIELNHYAKKYGLKTFEEYLSLEGEE